MKNTRKEEYTRYREAGKNKQNNQSGNIQNYCSSTYRVESDQKQIIIKNLKNDCEGLRKNQAEYHRLNEQYRQLQHKYKGLHEEKNNDDKDFKMRHDTAQRNISQLKNEVDALRSELRDKRLEINDLESDQASLKTNIDERNIELQNFRNDYKSSIADCEELAAEKQSLNHAYAKLKQLTSQALEESNLLKEDNDSVRIRLDQLSKYYEQLQIQQKILREKILGYQNQNNEIDGNINEMEEKLGELELAIKKAQEDFIHLQTEVAETNRESQKFKSENNHIQKSIQNEIIKNNNFVKNLKNVEYTLKVRTGQVEEGQQEINGLKGEIDNLDKINYKLSEDLQACKSHLENLGLVNYKLVQHLETFAEEDEDIRELVLRKQRVDNARLRVNQTQRGYKSQCEETRISSRSTKYN